MRRGRRTWKREFACEERPPFLGRIVKRIVFPSRNDPRAFLLRAILNNRCVLDYFLETTWMGGGRDDPLIYKMCRGLYFTCSNKNNKAFLSNKFLSIYSNRVRNNLTREIIPLTLPWRRNRFEMQVIFEQNFSSFSFIYWIENNFNVRDFIILVTFSFSSQ